MIDHFKNVKCMTLFVPIAELTPKYPLNQMANDQFTVEIATENTNHKDNLIDINYSTNNYFNLLLFYFQKLYTILFSFFLTKFPFISYIFFLTELKYCCIPSFHLKPFGYPLNNSERDIADKCVIHILSVSDIFQK